VPDRPAVRGFLHRRASPPRDGLVLTHGAGGNSSAKSLVALAIAFAEAGLSVLRCDLPYRQERPKGPPFPSGAARDREGLRQAVSELRGIAPGRVYLGGQSYGGRQASLLVAEEPGLADGLLLLSYPLHPPGRDKELRTAHFPALRAPAVFAHGSKDPFGSLDELETARASIPGPTVLVAIDGAGHGLGRGPRAPEPAPETIARIVEAFLSLVTTEAMRHRP
jgi:predicted alpha/beta-hydrolase family hydrolase